MGPNISYENQHCVHYEIPKLKITAMMRLHPKNSNYMTMPLIIFQISEYPDLVLPY